MTSINFPLKNLVIFIFLFLLSLWTLNGQTSGKKPLDHDVYEGWKTLGNPIISHDGQWASYTINPQKGDGFLYLVNLKTNALDSINRGYDAVFSPSSEFLGFKIKPQHAVTRKAKKDKKKEDEMPKDSLGIWIMKDNQVLKFPDVKSFKVPEESSTWLAYHHFEIKDTSRIDTTENKKNGNKSEGTDLVIFNPATKDSFTYRQVVEYTIADEGSLVGLVKQTGDSVKISTVILFNTNTTTDNTLFSSEGLVDHIVTDESGSKVAFLHHTDTAKVVGKNLYYWRVGMKDVEVIVDTVSDGMPENWGVSKNDKIWFSGDASKLFFGTAPLPDPEREDTLLEEEKPKVDVWNWQDGLLQTMQKVQLKNEKKKTYLAVFHIKDRKMVQLADSVVRVVRTMHEGDGDMAIGFDRKPYEKLISWEGSRYQDVFIIDVNTGNKELVMKKKSSFIELSPFGFYILWYEVSDSSWYAHDIREDKLVSLTRNIPINFYEETFDMPMDPYPYGRAGWLEKDGSVLIYDRYDIWKLDPAGEKLPINLTNSYGRKNKITFRYRRIDKEEYFIQSKKPLFLHGFSEETKQNGFYSSSPLLKMDPEELIGGEFYIENPVKAKNSDVIIWRKGSFRDYPDVYVSDLEISEFRKLSNTNPQAVNYFWGDPQLVHWTSFDNESLDGILYVPENIDLKKKYPMLIYFYEKSSHGLYRHYIPSPSSSSINIPYCVSNGYLVFRPDINYRDGYPGQSAYNAIVSGTMAMVNRFDFIDKDNMAIQGQSWGGYQVAYLVTQTNLYKAALAGAPVSNMTSAYGGIRWGSGMSRMFQYEQSQSRIGGTLWEKTPLYLENSPLFHAHKINTPLLIMHNDKDGAVPWYQGIELFVALRRLNKPAWMLVYNQEEHNLRKWPNRVDLSIRMMQFFDHYLKGAPAPEWMVKGIPAIEKGTNNGYKLID